MLANFRSRITPLVSCRLFLLAVIAGFSHSVSQPLTASEHPAICLLVLVPVTLFEEMPLCSDLTPYLGLSPLRPYSLERGDRWRKVLVQLREMGWGGPLWAFMKKEEIVRNLNQVLWQWKSCQIWVCFIFQYLFFFPVVFWLLLWSSSVCTLAFKILRKACETDLI